MTVGLFVMGRKLGTAREFVDFWEQLYRLPNEELYTDSISKPLTPSRVRQLYEWKNGGKLAAAKQQSMERNYIRRLPEIIDLPEDTPAEAFLERFNEGGAIWRIFWLHLWQPQNYPIYDQHVHRAMRLIEKGEASEIPSHNPTKISIYLNEFIPFFRNRFAGLDQRRVDRALWACGKYLKPFASLPLPSC